MNVDFKSILSFLNGQRQSGTTTLLKTISKGSKVWVLVANEREVAQFGKDTAISVLGLSSGRTHEPRPILMDNHTIGMMCHWHLEKVDELSEIIRQKDY